MIPRLMQFLVTARLEESDKIILLFGARQVGKTTVVKAIQSYLEAKGQRVLYLNCDIDEERAAINTTSRSVIERLVADLDVLLIDEAQGLDNPGLTLKNIYAIAPKLRLLATGSSSFELRNKLSDPLTGRYLDFILYPLSFAEVLDAGEEPANPVLRKNKADAILPSALLYGFYPEVYLLANPKDKQALLSRLVESYLFRDVLAFQRIRNSQAIKDLAKALAYQIGYEINENELANRLKIDRKTVVNYLDILEKSYVIVRLRPFSRNPRREIGKNYKVYFVDLGIRNALIGDFNPLPVRADQGALWENFLLIERMKLFANKAQQVEALFWRSYSGAEVDYIEKPQDAPLQAYEFKYGGAALARGSRSFQEQYQTPVQLINQDCYLQFIDGESPPQI